MQEFRDLIGRERPQREIAQALHFWARSQGAVAGGALQVTCADEAEAECVEAFQRGFVQYLLPPLKLARPAAFRVANLGGRYEWSAVHLAEEHFVLPANGDAFTLMVAKINAHVGWADAADADDARPHRLGMLRRYGRYSPCCGALTAMLDGSSGAHLDDLREAFRSEGRDRLAALGDPARVPPDLVPLHAALASARLQARKAVLDLQDRAHPSRSRWIVLPCVSLNRNDHDTEILCGIYAVDGRPGGREVTYTGLGDDPGAYQVEAVKERFRVTDDQLGSARPGRDHREIARKEMQLRRGGHPLLLADERLERVRKDVEQNKHRNHHHARALLRIALPILAEVAPVPVALLAFAQGAAGIHHAFRIQGIAREMEGTEEARRMLKEIHDQVDRLDGEHAEALLDLLMQEYSRSPL